MGSITFERLSTHASATWAGVAPSRCAMVSSADPGFASDPAASGNHGMNPMPSCSQYESTASLLRVTRLYSFCTVATVKCFAAALISATSTSLSPRWRMSPSFCISAITPNCSSRGTFASMRWSCQRSSRSTPRRRRLIITHCRRYSGRPTGSHELGPCRVSPPFVAMRRPL